LQAERLKAMSSTWKTMIFRVLELPGAMPSNMVLFGGRGSPAARKSLIRSVI
jgi:hypothetical protein